jgi:hypothetical protein
MKDAPAESLRPVLTGFRKLSLFEQAEYLKYLGLVIKRKNGSEKRRLLRFKTRLEKEMKITVKAL